MGVRLYVGNLPYRTTGEDLQTLFSQIGEVLSAEVAMDRDTGRSRGFGFVEMADQESATAAIRQYDGSLFEQRQLTVDMARPRGERGAAPRRGPGGYVERRGGYGERRDGYRSGYGERRDGYRSGYGERRDGYRSGYGERNERSVALGERRRDRYY